MENIRYQVSGCAAHSRLVPLLPSYWLDESASTNDDDDAPDFLWENAPRKETRAYRDIVKCYSHLPNGTAILDDKWALARLFSSTKTDKTAAPNLATLESHCFRGISGFQAFCNRIHMNHDPIKEPVCKNEPFQLPDLLEKANANETLISRPPTNLWVVKDANSNGAGGIWIVGPQNAAQFSDIVTSPLLEEHRYVAQRYAWPPVLYGGRKCHVRVYGLLTCDGRAFVHKRAFLHLANEPFCFQDSDFEESVHITNCCANSHDQHKFAGEICADLGATDFSKCQGQTVVPLGSFFPSISACVAELARRAFPFLRGGEANNGFEYIGMDFILSYNSKNMPIAYMLEVNAPPSQDTATGLAHAERLHDDVIRDILTLWVFPKVTNVARENPGGWKCVLDQGLQEIACTDSPIVPSKATILNKIRWAIFERKSSRVYDDEATAQDEQVCNDQAAIGKETAVSTLSGDAIAAFARTQFPYFSEYTQVAPSALPPLQIFFENAGGAQVPRQVIHAVSSSMSHRNRCLVGTKTKRAARRTLSTILGATGDEHMIFFGANASCLFEKLAQLYVKTGLLSSGDELIICAENHLANVIPWMAVARSVGATIKWWHIAGPESTKRGNESDYRHSHRLCDLLSNKTRVVAVSHASNILGQVRDLEAICKLTKDVSGGYAHVVADGVAAVPHVCASLATSGVDWYIISCHKLFGPHIGALCGRRGVVNLFLDSDTSIGDETIFKLFETGTTSYEACAGVEGLGRYFRALATFSVDEKFSDPQQTTNQCTGARQDRCENPSLRRPSCELVTELDETKELSNQVVAEAYNRITFAEMPLVELLRKLLCSSIHVKIVESEERPSLKKLPVFSFIHRLIPSSDIVRACNDAGIVCRQGTFLSTAALQKAFGYGAESYRKEGVVRVSLAHYNTTIEVKRLMEKLESLPNWRK